MARGAAPSARFAVLLPNSLVPAPPELSGATDRVLSVITGYLAAQGRERRVIDPLEAEEFWLASIAEAEQSDSVSHDFRGAMKLFVPRLGGLADFDALVVASLVYREGWLENRIVKWDGVVRRLSFVGEDAKPVPLSFESNVPVVSLHVMVFGANGELEFENYGGVDLAHSFRLDPRDESRLRVDLRHPVLEEHRFLREGVAAAFDPYLPRGRIDEW